MKLSNSKRRLAVLVPALVGCQALGPVLSSALVAFGQDLLSTASYNYRPQYAESLSNLLLAMAETTTGLQFSALPEDYYDRRIAELEAQRQAARDREPQQGYGQQAYGQGTYGQETYAQGGYGADTYAQETYAQDTGGEDAYDDAYGQDTYDQSIYEQDASVQTPYGQDAHAPYPSDPGADPYAYRSASPRRHALRSPYGGAPSPVGPETLTLDVALLASELRPDGSIGLREVADGDVLRDGGVDPAAGDKIKLSFRASCACHLYVIGVDATGWVTKIRPAPGERVVPLAAERDHLVPSGDTWWGLDQYKGVEQIYFLLSRNRRTDIEAALAALPDERPAIPAGYRGVREPAVVPVRGLVQVQSPASTPIPTATGTAQVTSTSFAASLDSADLVVTRWFEHR